MSNKPARNPLFLKQASKNRTKTSEKAQKTNGQTPEFTREQESTTNTNRKGQNNHRTTKHKQTIDG